MPTKRIAWLRGLAWGLLVAFYLATLGLRPLMAPDEWRYAEAAREMLASGDWTVPHLAGVVYLEKPVLGYWAIAASIALLGESALAVRLPSALATLGMAVILGALIRRYGPGRDWGAVAAVAFLTSVGVMAVGTAAVLDAMFAFWLTAALAAFWVASERPPSSARTGWLALCGVLCGLAFLTKGFLAFAIPASVAIPYLASRGRGRECLRLGAVPVVAAIVTAAPWAVAIAQREPGYWSGFLLDEHLRRFAGGASAQHAEPFWYYVPVLLVGLLPWTPLLALARREALESPLGRFALCWVAGPLLLLSLSSGKLATYPLPFFPALFILLALVVERRRPELRIRALRRLAIGLAVVWSVAGMASLSPWVSSLGPLAELTAQGERLAWAAGLWMAAGVAWVGGVGRSPAASVCAVAASMLAVFGTWIGFFPEWPLHKTPGPWLESRVAPVPEDAIVVAHRQLAYPLCWLLRRDDLFLLGHAGELADGFARPEARGRVLRDPAQLDALLRDPQRSRPVIVVTLRDRTPLPRRPKPTRSETAGRLAFAEYPPQRVRESMTFP